MKHNIFINFLNNYYSHSNNELFVLIFDKIKSIYYNIKKVCNSIIEIK